MSNAASDEADTQPPYRSFDDLLIAQIFPSKSAAAFRLFWTLGGPFPEAISVMEDGHSPSSLTPYFLYGNLHLISQEPISVPKISSVTVSVAELNNWEGMWLYLHEQHDDAGQPPSSRWHGTLDNYDPDRDSDEEENLLGCCEEPRPRGKRVTIVVEPASGDFVTVHDYLSTVHPWLMGLKRDIEGARAVVFDEHGASDLMVNLIELNWLSIDARSHWIERGTPIANQVFRTVLSSHTYTMSPAFRPDPPPSQPQPLA